MLKNILKILKTNMKIISIIFYLNVNNHRYIIPNIPIHLVLNMMKKTLIEALSNRTVVKFIFSLIIYHSNYCRKFIENNHDQFFILYHIQIQNKTKKCWNVFIQ